jgi:oxygen-dependent protoporphyrinogen oxidase
VASIVIVGGGVAGLTSAWHLRRAGHDVEVLESAPEPGGRLRTESRGDYALEYGARSVASGHRNWHSVVLALGLGDRAYALPRARSAVLRDGALHRADLTAPLQLLTTTLLSVRARARLPRLVLEVLARARVLDPLRPERAAALDGEDLADGVRRTVGKENLEYLLAPAFASRFGSAPEDLSWAFALLALRLRARGFREESLHGGLGGVTRALARRVPVRTGCEVVSIETETDGARVRYRARGRPGSAIADAVVAAVPGSEVVRLCPKLTPSERGFFEAVRYARGIVAHLLLEKAPAALPWSGVAFPRCEGLDLSGLVVDHHRMGAAPPGAGLVSAVLDPGAAARMWQAPDAEVGALVVDRLARTPIGTLAPGECVVHRWPAMLPQFGVGHLPRLSRFLTRMDRSPRLAFAGDYLIGPYVEAAVASGMRAASEVARGL